MLKKLLALLVACAGLAFGQWPKTFTDGTYELRVAKVTTQYGPSEQPIVRPGIMLYMQLRSLVVMDSYTITMCYVSAQNIVKQTSVTINTPPENNTVLWFPTTIWLEPATLQSISVRPNAPAIVYSNVE